MNPASILEMANWTPLHDRSRDLACEITALEENRDRYGLKERQALAKAKRAELAEVNAEIQRQNEERRTRARVAERQDYALDRALKVLQQREAIRILSEPAEQALHDPAAVGVENLRELLKEADEEAKYSGWRDLRTNAASRVERLTAAIRKLETGGRAA